VPRKSIYTKHITLTDQMKDHLDAWAEYQELEPLPKTFTLYIVKKPGKQKVHPQWPLLLLLIHRGTLNYLTNVPFETPSKKFFENISLFRKIVDSQPYELFQTTIFASTALALYGLYSSRSRDLKFWMFHRDPELYAKIHQAINYLIVKNPKWICMV
jgi:hypothetical protein